MKEIKNGYEFVSLATHQIRGPLGSIRGYVSMILDGDYGPVPLELIEPLNLILKSADSLGKTVNDFLDTSKMEQGQMRYYLKDFDLTELVQQVVKEMYLTIGENVELKVDLPKQPILIHGDKTKIRHVLLNLIDNANKYTEKGYIEISLNKKSDNKAVFAVKDSGIGVSKEIIPTLFQKFSRAPEASKVNSTGTGLGLYVVRKMVEAHHGRVWVESAGEGKGTQFYVELPSL